MKILKTARILISLSFRCGVKKVITCDSPRIVKLTCTKSNIKVPIEKVGRKHGVQAELLTGEIEHSVFNETNFGDLGHICEPYLELDVLRLGFIYARHSREMQKKSDFCNKDCLTEASQEWKCFGT